MHVFHDDYTIDLRAKSQLWNSLSVFGLPIAPFTLHAQAVVSSRFVQGLGFLCLPCAVSSIVILKPALTNMIKISATSDVSFYATLCTPVVVIEHGFDILGALPGDEWDDVR